MHCARRKTRVTLYPYRKQRFSWKALMKPVLLDLSGIAKKLGISEDSARTYHTRAVANRRNGNPRRGDLPVPTWTMGRSPVWDLKTITEWQRRRPGKGAGGGRPVTSDAAR